MKFKNASQRKAVMAKMKFGRFTRKTGEEDKRVRFWLESKRGEIITLIDVDVTPEIRISSKKGRRIVPISKSLFKTIPVKTVAEIGVRHIKQIR